MLLIAPTGGGKTLAGFLPTLVELSRGRGKRAAKQAASRPAAAARSRGLHTLYISPLKALAVDIARNLEIPGRARWACRSGWKRAPATRRPRSASASAAIRRTSCSPRRSSSRCCSRRADAPFLFGSLKRVVLDELHSLVTSKRGDLLSLGLARLFALAPQLTTVGLSATVAEPDELRRFLVPQPLDGAAHGRPR